MRERTERVLHASRRRARVSVLGIGIGVAQDVLHYIHLYKGANEDYVNFAPIPDRTP